MLLSRWIGPHTIWVLKLLQHGLAVEAARKQLFWKTGLHWRPEKYFDSIVRARCDGIDTDLAMPLPCVRPYKTQLRLLA